MTRNEETRRLIHDIWREKYTVPRRGWEILVEFVSRILIQKFRLHFKQI